METPTKLPGERLRLPELTLSSVNGGSSIPGKERVIHKRGDGGQGCVLLAKTAKPGEWFLRRLPRSL